MLGVVVSVSLLQPLWQYIIRRFSVGWLLPLVGECWVEARFATFWHKTIAMYHATTSLYLSLDIKHNPKTIPLQVELIPVHVDDWNIFLPRGPRTPRGDGSGRVTQGSSPLGWPCGAGKQDGKARCSKRVSQMRWASDWEVKHPGCCTAATQKSNHVRQS